MKPYRSIDAQVIIAHSRGMKIDDTTQFKQFLTRKNYFNSVHVYGKLFLEQPGTDKYLNKTTSSELMAVYYFDKEVRAILLSKLIEIETNLKSTIVSVFCKHHPYVDDLSDRSSFNLNPRYDFHFATYDQSIQRIISKYYESDPLRAPRNNPIDHYTRTHSGVPLWVLVNYMTFSNICNFYKIMKTNERSEVALSFRDSIMKSYHLQNPFSIQPHEFEKVIFAFKDLRNTVAHDVTLQTFKLRTSIPFIGFINRNESVSPSDPRQDLFSVFLAMQLFISKSNYAIFSNTIRKRSRTLDNSIHTISVNKVFLKLGFPSDWHNRNLLSL